MALNNTTADSLGSSIATALEGLSDDNKNDPEIIWQTIMRLIYTALKTDTVVNVTSVSGVTAGGAASGPGTGTVS